jgi:hypothetical protein
VTEQPADDYFVFMLSDAMLEQYNVSPQNLADALLSDPRVNSYCIFIGAQNLDTHVHIHNIFILVMKICVNVGGLPQARRTPRGVWAS